MSEKGLREKGTREKGKGMALLTPEDHAFFQQNGYAVIPNVVPKENLEAVIDAAWWFLEMDRNNPEDWYRKPHRTNGMVEMYQHQSLWENRQHPTVYQAFTEILGTPRLWVSMDRLSMKPPPHPAHPEYTHRTSIHWDLDTKKRPITFAVQGVLFLEDTEADQGGFECVPELYRRYEEWVQTQPEDRSPYSPDLSGFTIESVPGKAGDLLIWNRLLAHGSGLNHSTKSRFAQYITMSEAQEENEELRQKRISYWQERRNPPWYTPGDSRDHEHKFGQTAELTPLGRKLLGLDRWGEV